MKKQLAFGCLLAAGVAFGEEPATPTMGWSSWNTYRVNISEDLIRRQAKALVDGGYAAVGYKYVNIDDGWFGGRDKDGRQTTNLERFPNGLKPVADYIHSLGLKAGIYSDAGENTCGSIWDNDKLGIGVGFSGHDAEDADWYFDEMGFDFIKIDFGGGIPEGNRAHVRMNERERYTSIAREIARVQKKVGREIRMNVCCWRFPGEWVSDIAGSWRIGPDLGVIFESVKAQIDKCSYLARFQKPGHYNDMDMLQVGRGRMNAEEDRTHFGMWCMMNSPLLIGCDLTTIKPETAALLKNTDLIALNQDPLGRQAEVFSRHWKEDWRVYVKPLAPAGSMNRAIALYNGTESNQTVVAELDAMGYGWDEVTVWDCYEHKALPNAKISLKAEVPPHGTRIYRLAPVRGASVPCGILGAGVCLSAQPPTMGCAWYPEAWPKERRATDLELMQNAGIDSVRICEFNWANFEPQEGAFDFADFRGVLDELAKRKMTALMCTATAAPPRWLFEKYPEAWKVTDAGGKRMPVEHRRQYCVNNPDFRRRARALTEAQVAAFAGHPAIRAWQIDNELSSDAEGGHCTCRHCAAAFRTWLKRKYGTLENLNRAWNGAFWSNAVQNWEQIRPPFVTMIPVFRFDYTRFQSDSFQAFVEEQAAIIRAKDKRPVCYNSWMSFQGDFDLPKFTKDLDFVACDTYIGQDFMQIYRAAWDLYRGLKRQPFTIAETGPFNAITSRDNATDFLRPAYWEMFAHGADAVYWFRWRRSVMGEEACRAIIQYDGRPGRPHDVIAKTRRELLGVLGKTGDLPLPENRIAVLFSSWDVQLGRSEDKDIPPYGATTRHYAAIRSTGLGVDFVPVTPEADLSKYALVVAPRCEYLPDDFVRKLRDYVEGGGVLHAGVRLNVREDSCVYRTTPAPHGLTDVFGLSVREFCHVSTRNGESFATYKPARDVTGGKFTGPVAGGTATIDREMEDVTLAGATALEAFPGGLYKGAPLYAEHAFGKGRAFYQAACVDFETEKRLLKHAFGAAGLKPVADLPDDVSRVRRGDVVIYTNVREEPQTFKTSDTGTVLLGSAPANGGLTLPAYGVAVLQLDVEIGQAMTSKTEFR